ncbi:DWNN-domain-containing protein [Lentinus tigrinus ALCF2SS1-7]|uniref:DWNN-domain-containing protein n=1 Tax=Lentinus tigrinus ALCF2SS1-6 TaxID=1328759 RepID=A0A5C2SLR1_9APHY|nr:DWNN-domain-containing protein [Lentinus tigrinus ALCF2SS1-6]RPD76424.1 DWNN-domain-containing protein [Lentinus tigrinus ALCF2SS1-7]
MASSVFYRFRSQRDESRVTFDGTGISVFDLKKEIIIANNLGKANDFDLVVLDSSGEEYKDDSSIIPRSSSVVVKRVPARPGRGGVARYLGSAGPSQGSSDSSAKGTGGGGNVWHRGNMSKRFDGKEPREEPRPAQQQPPPAPLPSGVANEDEAAAMAAMFQAQTANWEEAQEKMSHQVRVQSNLRGGAPRGGKPYQPSHHHSDRPLPPSYVCYRCGQKGHWIQDCPTNNDREFDNRPRIKRTTGIPRSFLKAVDNPTTGPLGQGVMVTPEGGYVVAQPDSASWQRQVNRHKGLTEADIRERPPSDPSLACPIDGRLFRDAVKTPCCGTLYCEECVQTHLLERDFLCPNCARKIPSLDKLIIDKPMRARVHEFVDSEIERSRQEAEKVDKQETTEEKSQTDGASADGDKGASKIVEGANGGEGEEGFYNDAQNMDMSQFISQLQAQIQQLQVMLNNTSLPAQVRQQAQLKHQQLQVELQQAQTVAAMAAAQSFNMPAMAGGMGGNMGGGGMNGGMGGNMNMQSEYRQWTNPFPNQQPAGQDSAYQRLPLNNRRRPLKRDRPSDFLEIAGAQQGDAKTARYWE